MDLRRKDLSYMLGALGWISNESLSRRQKLTFYLDDIRYSNSRPNDPRFFVSYETVLSSEAFDTVMKNMAFSSDNALATLAYLTRGTSDDLQRARLIAGAFAYAAKNDRDFADERVRNAYQGGDLTYPPGWTPQGKVAAVRVLGWWNPEQGVWEEHSSFLGTRTGNAAWGILALLAVNQVTSDTKYLAAAATFGEWIETHTRDTPSSSGYTGGYEGKRPPQTKLLWKSTEHNLDVFVAFTRMHAVTNAPCW